MRDSRVKFQDLEIGDKFVNLTNGWTYRKSVDSPRGGGRAVFVSGRDMPSGLVETTCLFPKDIYVKKVE